MGTGPQGQFNKLVEGGSLTPGLVSSFKHNREVRNRILDNHCIKLIFLSSFGEPRKSLELLVFDEAANVNWDLGQHFL